MEKKVSSIYRQIKKSQIYSISDINNTRKMSNDVVTVKVSISNRNMHHPNPVACFKRTF